MCTAFDFIVDKDFRGQILIRNPVLTKDNKSILMPLERLRRKNTFTPKLCVKA